mgnify:CR=1 FL=1
MEIAFYCLPMLWQSCTLWVQWIGFILMWQNVVRPHRSLKTDRTYRWLIASCQSSEGKNRNFSAFMTRTCATSFTFWGNKFKIQSDKILISWNTATCLPWILSISHSQCVQDNKSSFVAHPTTICNLQISAAKTWTTLSYLQTWH